MLQRSALKLVGFLLFPLAVQAAPPTKAPKPVALRANPYGVKLLEARVKTGQPVRGVAPTRAARNVPGWKLKLQPHPSPGAAASATVSLVGPGAKPRVTGAGDTVRFEAVVTWSSAGEPPFGVALHTNANRAANRDPFQDYSMQLVSRDGATLRYAIDLPIHVAGTFNAKAVVVKDSHALAWSGGGDYQFHPYFVEHDRVNEKLVFVANLGSGKLGTFEDMIGKEAVPNPKGKYTLNHMRRQGATAVRLLPFATSNSTPYSRSSFFDVWVEHSQEALRVREQIQSFKQRNPGPKLDRAKKAELAQLESRMYKAAIGSLRTFINEAHKKGIRVFVDYVANHTGPDMRIIDAFFKDAGGNAMDIFDVERTAASLEVRTNDPSQLALDRGHLARMMKGIRNAAHKGQRSSLQKIATHLYSKWGDGRGATNLDEIVDGGWGAWTKPGTWQLNHGGERYEDKHVGAPQTALTRGYILRDMAFLVLLGVDGFRMDHWNGMPDVFGRDGLNKLHAVAAKYRPGTKLFFNGEHFHRDGHEAYLDAREMGGFKATMGAQGPDQFRTAIDASWRQSSINDVGNHDEGGGIKHYGNNPRAFARLLALNALVGGPAGSKMLDELAESHPVEIDQNHLGHKAWGLRNGTPEMKQVSIVARNAGRARLAIPALAERQHDWLQQTSGAWHSNIVVAARYRTSANDRELAVVASNFHGTQTEHGTFQLTDAAKGRLKDDALYMGYNYMGNPRQPLWSKPMSGREIKQKGVFFRLAPDETQVLDLRELTGGRKRAPRERNSLYTIGGGLAF